MKGTMKLQIRDKRDPFTQSLAFLFKTESNAVELRQRLRDQLVPLVTQVAVKIGGIDTERAVRNRALAVFTGTASLHLASTTAGKEGEVVSEWASTVANTDMAMLFRKGYTLLDELVTIADNEVSFGDWLANVRKRGYKSSFFTKADFLEKHSTARDESGAWNGYGSLKDLFDTKRHFEFTMWLVRLANAEKAIVENRLDYLEAESVVNRIIINVMFSGRVSLSMDYKRVKSVIDSALGNKQWIAKALRRYEGFVSSLPEPFQSQLRDETSILRQYQFEFWKMVGTWKSKHLSKIHAVNKLCMSVGVPPPGTFSDQEKEDRRKHLGEYKID